MGGDISSDSSLMPTEIRRGKRLVILGFVAIIMIFLLYARYQNPELLTPDAIAPIQRIAYGFYIVLVVALGAMAYGMYLYHKGKKDTPADPNKYNDLFYVIAITTWNTRSRRVFVSVFVIYGIFFALVSGTLVYQPDVNFVTHYGAEIPSWFVSPCCDAPGYMPKMIIYLTEHIGLQIIPINLVLQITVSYLVGLNAAVALNAYNVSRGKRGLGTIGATAGLFVACPTCAGTFLSVFVGTASGIALSVALAQLQTLFIAISIPVLLITPYMMARKIRDGGCNESKECVM